MTSAEPTPRPGWWHGARRRIYLDMHMPEHGTQAPPGVPVAFGHLDPEAIAERAAAVGANVLVFYAKDNQGNSFYPTELGHHLADLGGRDVVAEFVDALHRRDIRAVAYFQPIRDLRTWEDHPQWRQITNDGGERVLDAHLQLGRGGHRLVCPLGPAGDATLAHLGEVVSCYDIDGVWWDRVGDVFGPDFWFSCFCDSCQTQYRAHAGDDIPRTPDWDNPQWRRYYQWRADALLAFQRRAHDIVSKRGGDVCLISNYVLFGMVLADPWPLSVDWEQIADATDVACLEFQHMRSYLHMSSHPMLMRALTDRPVEIINWNNGQIGDGYVRSPIAAEAAVHTALARGHATVLHDTVDQQGGVDPRLWELAHHLFDRARKLEPEQRGARPLTYAAILFSPNTYTWHTQGKPHDYVEELMGILRQLIEAHIPTEMISDRHLTSDALAAFELVVLPDAACLDDQACDALGQWVAGGGVLLASHQTSRRRADGTPRPDFGLADVFGVRCTGEMASGPRWMQPQPGPLADVSWGEYPVALRTAATEVEPGPETTVAALFGEPLAGLDTFANFIPGTARWGPAPAVTVHRYGQGHAVYVAGRCGQDDLRFGVAELSGPLRVAASLAPTPPVSIEAPACVEMIAQQRADGGWLLHLINFPGEISRSHRMTSLPAHTYGPRGVIPIHDLTIYTDRPVSAARNLLNQSEPSVERAGDGSRITLPEMATTAVIALDL